MLCNLRKIPSTPSTVDGFQKSKKNTTTTFFSLGYITKTLEWWLTNQLPTSLNLVSDWQPDFWLFSQLITLLRLGGYQTRDRHLWPPKNGFGDGWREMFFFFLRMRFWCFFLLGGLFWIFLILFFWDLWELLLLPGVFFPRKTPSVYSIRFFFGSQFARYFSFFHLISWIQGGLPAFFFCSVNKMEAFFRFQASCVLFFVFPSKNHLRDGRNPKGKDRKGHYFFTTDIHGRRTITETRGTRHSILNLSYKRWWVLNQAILKKNGDWTAII